MALLSGPLGILSKCQDYSTVHFHSVLELRANESRALSTELHSQSECSCFHTVTTDGYYPHKLKFIGSYQQV